MSVLHGDYAVSVGVHVGGKPADLKRVYRLAGVAGAVPRNMVKNAVLGEHGGVFVVLKLFYGMLKRFFHFLRLNGLKLKDRAAAQNRVINIEIRIFRGGCDKGNSAVLDELQQGLLLFFAQVLNFVKI